MRRAQWYAQQATQALDTCILASCLPFLPHRAPAAQHAGKKGGTQVTCLRGPLVMKMSAAGGKEPSVALSAVMAMNDLCPG